MANKVVIKKEGEAHIASPDEILGAVPADKTPSEEKVHISKEPTPEELLEVAKGAADLSEIEGFEKNYWVLESNKKRDVIHFRREVRRGIYRIIKWTRLGKDWKADPRLEQLSRIIGEQLDANRGLRWQTFADVWDIHPKEPLRVIIKEHWVKEGGGFDADLGYHYPHAFTVKKENI